MALIELTPRRRVVRGRSRRRILRRAARRGSERPPARDRRFHDEDEVQTSWAKQCGVEPLPARKEAAGDKGLKVGRTATMPCALSLLEDAA